MGNRLNALTMNNNFCFVGLLTECGSLFSDHTAAGNSYQYKDIVIKADDGSSQSLHLRLTGQVAVQLDTYNLQPSTMLCAYFKIYSYINEVDGRRCNAIRCWKVEVMGNGGEIVGVCRK